jgi:hypothetical protein
VSIREKIYDGLKIRREMANSVEQLRKRLGPSWEQQQDSSQLESLGKKKKKNQKIFCVNK